MPSSDCRQDGSNVVPLVAAIIVKVVSVGMVDECGGGRGGVGLDGGGDDGGKGDSYGNGGYDGRVGGHKRLWLCWWWQRWARYIR